MPHTTKTSNMLLVCQRKHNVNFIVTIRRKSSIFKPGDHLTLSIGMSRCDITLVSVSRIYFNRKCYYLFLGTLSNESAGYRACRCLEGFYRLDRFGPCSECPAHGINCVNDTAILVPNYYWKWTNQSNSFFIRISCKTSILTKLITIRTTPDLSCLFQSQ